MSRNCLILESASAAVVWRATMHQPSAALTTVMSNGTCASCESAMMSATLVAASSSSKYAMTAHESSTTAFGFLGIRTLAPASFQPLGSSSVLFPETFLADCERNHGLLA